MRPVASHTAAGQHGGWENNASKAVHDTVASSCGSARACVCEHMHARARAGLPASGKQKEAVAKYHPPVRRAGAACPAELHAVGAAEFKTCEVATMAPGAGHDLHRCAPSWPWRGLCTYRGAAVTCKTVAARTHTRTCARTLACRHAAHASFFSAAAAPVESQSFRGRSRSSCCRCRARGSGVSGMLR